LTLAIILAYVPVALCYLLYSGQIGAADWRTASRAPVGLAPDPAKTPDAVVQVYSARAVSWRGWFGVHTWIAVKPTGAREFTVHEVIGWRLRRTGNVVAQSNRAPDSRWYGAKPELLADVRGPGVDALIERIETAVKQYPYPGRYHVWPGPNSNTFVQAALDSVPELRAVLPPTAIGKDFPYNGRWIGVTPSGTGVYASLAGYVGVMVGWVEGFEVNFFGAVIGIDIRRPALKLPGLGRLGIAAGF
jgi:hypothetical protein